MSIKETPREKNTTKFVSISAKYKKPRINPISINIEEKNSRNILKNAGKELINSNSENYLTMENPIFNSSISYSIVSPDHRGIKMKGYDLYDPYLLQICKSAIFREKKELPNYKDIIQKINLRYGIENEKYNEIDSYYKKLIKKNNKTIEKYINSLKNAKKEDNKPKKHLEKEEKE